MKNGKMMSVIFCAAFLFSSALCAQETMKRKTLMSISIREPKVAFSVNSLDETGNAPVGLHGMKVFAVLCNKHRIEGKLVAVFYGPAVKYLLTDQAYNTLFKVRTGNPAKSAVLELIKSGIQVEVCYKGLEALGGSSQFLLPGVLPTLQGLLRLVELSQDGYTLINP